MKLMSMKQYSKMTKASLVRKIMKALKKLPKTKLIKLCYELEKRRLPTISTTKRNMPRLTARKAYIEKSPWKKPYPQSMYSKIYPARHRRRTQKHDRLMARKKPRSTRVKVPRTRTLSGYPRRLIKGSPEAKRYMAKIRRMRK